MVYNKRNITILCISWALDRSRCVCLGHIHLDLRSRRIWPKHTQLERSGAQDMQSMVIFLLLYTTFNKIEVQNDSLHKVSVYTRYMVNTGYYTRYMGNTEFAICQVVFGP